jgi:hypothetical protein
MALMGKFRLFDFLNLSAAFAVLWVWDLQAVVVSAFGNDRFYHVDSFLMAPGWAYANGLALNMDIGSAYSIIIPAVFGSLAAALGRFDYAFAYGFVMAVGFLYVAFFLWVIACLAWASFAGCFRDVDFYRLAFLSYRDRANHLALPFHDAVAFFVGCGIVLLHLAALPNIQEAVACRGERGLRHWYFLDAGCGRVYDFCLAGVFGDRGLEAATGMV